MAELVVAAVRLVTIGITIAEKQARKMQENKDRADQVELAGRFPTVLQTIQTLTPLQKSLELTYDNTVAGGLRVAPIPAPSFKTAAPEPYTGPNEINPNDVGPQLAYKANAGENIEISIHAVPGETSPFVGYNGLGPCVIRACVILRNRGPTPIKCSSIGGWVNLLGGGNYVKGMKRDKSSEIIVKEEFTWTKSPVEFETTALALSPTLVPGQTYAYRFEFAISKELVPSFDTIYYHEYKMYMRYFVGAGAWIPTGKLDKKTKKEIKNKVSLSFNFDVPLYNVPLVKYICSPAMPISATTRGEFLTITGSLDRSVVWPNGIINCQINVQPTNPSSKPPSIRLVEARFLEIYGSNELSLNNLPLRLRHGIMARTTIDPSRADLSTLSYNLQLQLPSSSSRSTKKQDEINPDGVYFKGLVIAHGVSLQVTVDSGNIKRGAVVETCELTVFVPSVPYDKCQKLMAEYGHLM
ncbi:hypothetical protein HDU76_000826 [Blyttiomyces sp. JEL0837]|nr:hypothetical protein HDU76_000826 [Blyttiomyces sp. JEL0837]